MKSLYKLYHYHEILEDGEVHNIKALGIFSSKKQVYEAIKAYKELPGFREKCKVAIGYDDFVEGFFISHMPIGISYWDGGFVTVAEIMSGDGTIIYEEPKEKFLEVTLSLPSWFKDEEQELDGTSEEFAERIMGPQYHTDDHPRGPQSEFFQIKKFKEMQQNLL